jgi:hypothetical protein
MATGGGQQHHWSAYRETYRRDWERGHPAICWLCWDLAEHAFRYGWEMAQDPQLAGHDFLEAEGTLRQHWPQYDRRFHESQIGIPLEHSWDDVHDAIRQGWERGRRTAQRGTTHHDA